MIEDELQGDWWEIDRVEGGDIYVKEHPYPLHSNPIIPAIEIANRIKKYIRTFDIRILFVRVDQYPITSVFGKEIYKFLSHLCGARIARRITHVLEYDLAYRWRLQDLFSSVEEISLRVDPHGTVEYLLDLNITRDYKHTSVHEQPLVSEKIGKLGAVVLFLLRVWPVIWLFRRALRHVDYSKLCFDKADRYWCCFRKDYNFFGVTYEERQRLLTTLG